jgi:4-amino-4-deoxy-L-arabinose transferase-like glycosyltransferase
VSAGQRPLEDGGPSPAAPTPSLLRAWLPKGTWRLLLIPLGAYVVLHFPALFEPHWYTDEAGYSVTAWLANHGVVLYAGVWNNKPPLLFWLYGLVITWFGPSEAGLHTFSMITGLLALVGLWKLVLDGWGPRRACVAVSIGAFLLGTPVLNGDLALPENLLIAPTALAMVVTLLALGPASRRQQLWRGVGAGTLFAAAILIQQTALADLAAAGLWLLLLPDRRGLRQLWVMVSTALVLIVVALLPYAIRVGARHLYYLLVTSYIGYEKGSSGFGIANLAPHVIAAAALLIGAVLSRHSNRRQLLLWIWAAAVLLAETAPNKPYIFFSIPMVVPLTALVVSAPWRHLWRLRGTRTWPRWRPVVTGSPLALAVLLPFGIWLGLLVTNPESTYSVRLGEVYYQNFVGRAVGLVSPAAYSNTFDLRAGPDALVAKWVRQNDLSGCSAVVWSSLAWDYVLADLRPVVPTPAIYVDEAWLGPNKVLDDIERGRPKVVITDSTSISQWPGVKVLLRRGYVETYHVAMMAVWVDRRAFGTAEAGRLVSSSERPLAAVVSSCGDSS